MHTAVWPGASEDDDEEEEEEAGGGGHKVVGGCRVLRHCEP